MKKIPTVEEFLIQKRGCVKNGKLFDYVEEEDVIEFTKLHVERALKEASEKTYKSSVGFGNVYHTEEAKLSILNSYSLENIK